MHLEDLFQFNIESMGLDLEYDADVPPTGHEPATYEPVFMSTHKAPCRSATFNTDGLVFNLYKKLIGFHSRISRGSWVSRLLNKDLRSRKNNC